MHRFVIRAAGSAAMLLGLPVVAAAQALPPAQQLVDRYVQAIGGADNYKRHQSMRMQATVEAPAMGMRGEMDVRQKQPNLMAMTLTLPGMGEIRSGFDGTTAWAIDPMGGARVLDGAELVQTRDQAQWGATLRTPEYVQELQTVERTEMGGQSCYKVKVVWKSGRESHDCFSTESGLLVGTTAEQESNMGTIRVETLLSDYKEFGGVRMPTKMTQNMMGMQQTITINNVEFGTVTDAELEPPAQIKALKGN